MSVRYTLPLFFTLFSLSEATEFRYPAVFNFGDSNSDTGGLVAGTVAALDPPNGHTYFHQPSGRFCDGRLVLDFLVDAMDLPFLNPYLESIGAPSFQTGCDFAVAGSTVIQVAGSVSPFPFGIQVAQFLRFKAKALDLLAKGNKLGKYLPREKYFNQGLYMFDIGQNDLNIAFRTKSEKEVFAYIPSILLELETGIKKLYDEGARKFWIHNTAPLGCLPQNIATYGQDPSKLDELGCVISHNRAAKFFNLQLHTLSRKLQGQFLDTSVTYTDMYSIKLDLIANYSRYGFEQPTMACCGYGGPPLNFDNAIRCGRTGSVNGTLVTAKGCDDSSKYVIWDGIHYTEAANRHVSTQILTAVFNFGDSNSDTGGLVAGTAEPLDPPNGQMYFHKPSGRFCDGRLIIDFLLDAMDLPFLNAYLESIGAPSFQKGCNFAAAGSTVLPATAYSVSPFSLGIQVAQFLRFKARVLDLLAKGNRRLERFLPREQYFTQGLYMFDIGQNDLAGAFYTKSEDQVLASIPCILSGFETGIQKLYEQGARKFWIHNTSPLGCLPENINVFGKDSSKLDELGCLSSHNRAAKLFNLQLHALCRRLQNQFTDADITYTDIFTIKLNLISNYSKYGFEQPRMACCGCGGPPLNYDNRIPCGRTKSLNGTSVTAKGCDDSTEYIIWDGIHYTEAANRHISSEILTGKYSDPPFADKMPFLLKLKF